MVDAGASMQLSFIWSSFAMKTGFFTFLLLVCAAALPQADASIWDFFSFDGIRDKVEDESRSQIFDTGSGGVVGIGDVIYGVIRIDGIDGNPTGSTTWAAFSWEITGTFTVPGAVGAIYNGFYLSATSKANSKSLYNLIDGSVAGRPGDLNPLWDNAAVVAFDTPPLTGGNDLTTRIDAGTLSVDDAVGASGMSGASSTMRALLGEVGDDEITVRLRKTEGNGTTTWSGLTGLAGENPIGNERFGLSVLYTNPIMPGVQIIKEKTTLLDGTEIEADFGTGVASGGDQGLFLSAVGSSSSSTAFFTDQGNMYLNAVPEPASIAVWSLLAVGCVAFGRRRLSRKAA